MITISPVQQVHSSTTPAYIRTLLGGPADSSEHYLSIAGDTFGGTHPVVQLLDHFHPIVSYGDTDEDTLLLFAPSLADAHVLRQQVSETLQRLPLRYRLGLR